MYDLKGIIAAHAQGFVEAGCVQHPDIAVALHTYVSENPSNTRPESEEALNRYVASRLYAKRRSYDQLDTAGLLLFGNPEQVSERIHELAAIRVNHLMILADFGGLNADLVQASLKRFV